MEVLWQKVAAGNLVKHKSGGYYLQAKVNGKKVRKALGTKRLDVAKMKRDELLAELRPLRVVNKAGSVETLSQAVEVVLFRKKNDSRTKESTKAFWDYIAKALTIGTETKRV